PPMVAEWETISSRRRRSTVEEEACETVLGGQAQNPKQTRPLNSKGRRQRRRTGPAGPVLQGRQNTSIHMRFRSNRFLSTPQRSELHQPRLKRLLRRIGERSRRAGSPARNMQPENAPLLKLLHTRERGGVDPTAHRQIGDTVILVVLPQPGSGRLE